MGQIRFTKLHDKLFMRGHTKGADLDNMLQALHERQISMVINVAIIPDLYLAGALRTIGKEYIHEPLSDSHTKPFSQETVRSLVATVVKTVAHGWGVLIHCDSGRNRSALIAIPALAEISGRPTEEILTEVRLKRPIARGVLDNPRFRKFVLNWQVVKGEGCADQDL